MTIDDELERARVLKELGIPEHRPHPDDFGFHPDDLRDYRIAVGELDEFGNEPDEMDGAFFEHDQDGFAIEAL